MTAKPVPEHIDMRVATDEGLTPDQSAMKTAALAFYGEHGITAMSGTIPPQFERAIIAYAAASPASGVRAKAWSDNFVGLQHWRDEDNEDAITLTRNDIISLIEDYRSAIGEHP